MLKTGSSMSSAASAFQTRLKANLNDYFSATVFKFSNDAHVDYLRRQMELVYLREFPLVAIDVEAYEQNNRKITEIGVSIYDPENQWYSVMPRIKTVHVIIKEHKRLINFKFVPNNKFRFNGGASYEMTLQESKIYLNQVFNHFLVERKGVLVGHNVAGDIRWLAQHGVKNAQDVPAVDTQKLFNLSKRSGATLRGILRRVEIPHANLHNAANDAYYTLLAAMSYCDPQQRFHFKLDTFDGSSVTAAQLKQKKSLATSEKFTDRSKILPAQEAPLIGNF